MTSEPAVEPVMARQFLRDGAVVTRERTYDTVDLFLFSAATWNPHRVHYDERYTREVAGESGLLVQGPLQAATMFQTLRDALAANVVMQRLRYRHVAVLHAGEPARIAGRVRTVEAGTATVEMWVESLVSGMPTTTGTAHLHRLTPTGPAGQSGRGTS